MEIEHLIQLVNTVSSSELTEFSYCENGVTVAMKKECEKVLVAETAATKKIAVETGKNSTEEKQHSGKIIKSPLVGTYYAAPSVDAEPFVKVGDSVKKGQTLAIVEAMKLMNEIESEWDGTVTEVFVENEQPVEYGQPLFSIA